MLADLKNFLESNKISAEVFETKGEVHSAARAAVELGSDENEALVKSILLMDSNAKPLLVILLGSDKIDFQKIKLLLGVKDVRLASSEEVLEITGYEIGGVPPISIYGVRTIIDKHVSDKEKVVCGGGDKQHLMRIKINDIIDNIEEFSVEDVSK